MTAPLPEHIRLGEDGRSVVILDQSLLPGRVEERAVSSLEGMVEAIRTLQTLEGGRQAVDC